MPVYRRSDMLATIEDYVINSSYRDVLRYRYCEGYTYEKIAEICNYSTQHVKHICKTFKPILFANL